FSLWNGHRPLSLPRPAGLRLTTSPMTSAMGSRSLIRSLASELTTCPSTRQTTLASGPCLRREERQVAHRDDVAPGLAFREHDQRGDHLGAHASQHVLEAIQGTARGHDVVHYRDPL